MRRVLLHDEVSRTALRLAGGAVALSSCPSSQQLRLASSSSSSNGVVEESTVNIKGKNVRIKRYAPQNTLWLRFRRQFDAYTNPIRDPVYYSQKGFSDPLAEEVSGGRADPEYARLKLLCMFCIASTWGSWLYAIYFPERMKAYKDEPWSPFKY